MVCDADPRSRRAVEAAMQRAGIEVVLTASAVSTIVREARVLGPDIVVVDLTLAGETGLGIVAQLVGPTPECAVVLLSPFDTLRQAALEAGAYELIVTEDIQRLQSCVEMIADARRDARGPSGPLPDVGALDSYERARRHGQHEGVLPVDKVTAVGPSELASDGEA
jgi:ActR/RegA family two-component response regulator